MALLDNVFEGWGSSVLIGVGVALAAPILFPALAAGARPLAKTLVKGYLVMADAVSEVVAETGEQLSDLVAEARAEREAMATAATPSPESSRLITPS